MEEVDFDSAGVRNLNWNSYPIIRCRFCPDPQMLLWTAIALKGLRSGWVWIYNRRHAAGSAV
jgi:hypothetical protein